MEKRILLAGAVRGLVSEGERIVALIEKEKPGVLAMSVSREGLEVMGRSAKHKPGEATAMNPEEEVYITGLSEYGEVMKPPPCFSMAQKHAVKSKIPLEALDMDDEHYTAAFCKYVSTLDMMRQGNSGRQLKRHPFTAETPEEFIMEWDGLVNRHRGYRDLENAREEWLAKGIDRLAERHERVLAIVELERLSGVEKRLKAMGRDCEVVH